MKRLFHHKEFGVLLILLVEVVFFTLFTYDPGQGSSTFFNSRTLNLILQRVFPIGIAATGAALIIISGGIDLSVGSVMSLGAVFSGYCLVVPGWPGWAAIASALTAGILCGVLNGTAVSLVRIPPFVATLGMMSIARGVAYSVTAGRSLSSFGGFTEDFGRAGVWGIPVPALIMLALTGLLFFWEQRSCVGRYVHAMGGNEEAARLAGVRVRRIRVELYAFAGLMAALAGMLMAAHDGYASSSVARGYELEVIAACVVGGISLSGGQGSVLGAMIGAMILGTLATGLTLMGVGNFWVDIIKGSAVIVALALDSWKHRVPKFIEAALMAPFRYLPGPLREGLAHLLGSLIYVIAQRRRKIAIDNVTQALGEEGARRIARLSFVHVVRRGLETFQLTRWKGKLATHFNAEGLENFGVALEKGKGVLAVVTHLGNGDYGAAGIADAGYPVAMMVRPPSNAWARDKLEEVRRTMGIETIPRREGLPGLRRALKQGKVVLIALDQHASRNYVVVDFFGRPAKTVNVAAVLALRYRTPIVVAVNWKEGDRHHARIYPPIEAIRTSDLATDIRNLTQQLTKIIEEAVREHPEQWFWMHRRWRVPEEEVPPAG